MKRQRWFVISVLVLLLLGSGSGAMIGYTTRSLINHNYMLGDPAMDNAYNDLVSDGHILSPIDSLSSQNDLAGLEVLVVGLVGMSYSLSEAQIDVVEAFVLGGGNLVFLGENNLFNLNNRAVGGRFGISYPDLSPLDDVLTDVPLPRHPIMDGPYGTVNTVDGSVNGPNGYGSMDDPGPYGRSILNFPSGDNGVGVDSGGVVIERNALAPGSGILVAYAEINIWTNSYFDGDNQALWRNTFAYVPEPATMVLLGLGGVILRRRVG